MVTGAYYSFYVKSVNFNGVSSESQSAVFSVCLAPQQIDSPDYVSSTPNSITLSWKPPAFVGGCPILTYVMYMNDGQPQSNFTEVDSSLLLNKPYITNHTFSNLVYLGNTYSFKVKVVTEVGSTTSLVTKVLLSAVPNKPTDVPV